MLHRQLIKTAHCSSPSKRTYIHAVSIRPRLADHYALQATQLRQRRMFFGIGELLGVITNVRMGGDPRVEDGRRARKG